MRSQDCARRGDPVGARRHDHPRRSGDWRRAARQSRCAGNADPNARRIIAYGLRNPVPVRIPTGDERDLDRRRGLDDWEEIDRILDPTDATVENFGWPCYEGSSRQAGYDAADLSICENLYGAAERGSRSPYFAYNHANKVVAGRDVLRPAARPISGMSFEFAPTGDALPGRIPGRALLRRLLARLHLGDAEERQPDPISRIIETFVADAANPVNLEFGPDGDLYYVDFDGGTIRRIETTSEDKAAGRSTSASSTYGPGYESDKAVDSSSSTRWSSTFTDSQSWQVDLGSA